MTIAYAPYASGVRLSANYAFQNEASSVELLHSIVHESTVSIRFVVRNDQAFSVLNEDRTARAAMDSGRLTAVSEAERHGLVRNFLDGASRTFGIFPARRPPRTAANALESVEHRIGRAVSSVRSANAR